MPHQYLEAAWAAVINDRYLDPWEPPDEDWLGPIRGPLSIAMLIIKEAVMTAIFEFSPGIAPSYISNLVGYVLKDRTPFLRWRELVLNRLKKFYPLNLEETLGEVVPREALDPDFNFSPEFTEKLINKFLGSLDYKTNPFLNSPEEMISLKFEGTPYKFDIEKDRLDRFEW